MGHSQSKTRSSNSWTYIDLMGLVKKGAIQSNQVPGLITANKIRVPVAPGKLDPDCKKVLALIESTKGLLDGWFLVGIAPLMVEIPVVGALFWVYLINSRMIKPAEKLGHSIKTNYLRYLMIFFFMCSLVPGLDTMLHLRFKPATIIARALIDQIRSAAKMQPKYRKRLRSPPPGCM